MNPIATCIVLSLAALAMYWHLTTAHGLAGVRRYIEGEMDLSDPLVRDTAELAVRECASNSRWFCLFLAAYCAAFAFCLQHFGI
jgi:hypothetical protein